jgi:hypothetical protein
MKAFITTGLLAASLALTGHAAMAATPANPIPRAPQVSHARVAYAPVYGAPRVAARGYAPCNQLGLDIRQFIQGMLGGGPVPYANLIRDVQRMPASRGSSGSSYSPSYDNSPTVDTSSAASDSQPASDAENQAIQQMNDTNALNASMAAAEQENDAANAATLQTEINAGM